MACAAAPDAYLHSIIQEKELDSLNNNRYNNEATLLCPEGAAAGR